MHSVSNNFPASKAHQKHQWLQLKSHSWLAIKLCASMMMIMSGNNGCNACQRGNTATFQHQRQQLQQFAAGWENQDESKASYCFWPCKFLISNLPCSFKEPKAAVRWLLGPWQNILVHHAKVSGVILQTALLRESFIQVLDDQRIIFQLASSSDLLQNWKHSAIMLQ